MLMFLLRRSVLAVLVALSVSIITFALLHFTIDPAFAMAGEDATDADVQALREAMGFDRPVHVQYLGWLGNVLTGDFGVSPYFGLPVSDLIVERLPITLTLGALATVFAVGLGVPLGVISAIWPNTLIDRLSLSLAVFGQAIPNFWFSLVLIIFLAVQFPIFPVSGAESLGSYVLPTIVLGTNAIPPIMRLTRTGMLDVLSSDYIRTAWAKGVRPQQVFFKHALRNAIVPVVAVAAIQAANMFGGSIVVEAVFALHGIGMLAYESILRSDIPTMQAVILIFSMFFIAFSALSDILNAWLDPRMRVA
ncbi:MAG: ABC transporter permease [Roseicyclus sp.]|jgi:peptide/nickel transport system permease protein|uniref:ABC transporter permease n=1 Tax=Roseicyclus sp. TaxID=1914329 RepID=UPI003BB04DF3